MLLCFRHLIFFAYNVDFVEEVCMKKGRYQSHQNTSPNWIVILLLLLILLVGVLIFLLLRSEPIEVSTPNGMSYKETGPLEKNEDTISIPGYEGISLKADTKQQTIGFPNPAENTCYFQISLYLEDGTLLWKSDLVKPGMISEPLVLNQSLPAGTYPNTKLKYDCFTMDKNRSPLNGAETKLTLRVK